MRHYLKSERVHCGIAGKYKYRYNVVCRSCSKNYWIHHWPKSEIRCKSCAGKETYTLPQNERADIRKRGDGYITRQGYHLIFDGNRYTPAHRIPFPELPPEIVVHHIDGDKLNNRIDNLIPLSKSEHRKAHGNLERLSYELIQNGLIVYDRDSNSYRFSSFMAKAMELNPVNSGEPLTDAAEGNPEPSPDWGRCNDYPIEEYIRSLMEARDTQTDECCG